uniref:Ovule protein n=1 Tax=Heterorhabditis bacteriophora TaxID=37862 RepID=A0A1I7XTH6_HETBA
MSAESNSYLLWKTSKKEASHVTDKQECTLRICRNADACWNIKSCNNVVTSTDQTKLRMRQVFTISRALETPIDCESQMNF